MKELRIQIAGDPYRVAFAFDSRQTAILLVGGRKGSKKYYKRLIAAADKIYREYLAEIKKEGLI
jgi:hypothetical protein